jgi:hypothetical protein
MCAVYAAAQVRVSIRPVGQPARVSNYREVLNVIPLVVLIVVLSVFAS